jgi:hypothetical protein
MRFFATNFIMLFLCCIVQMEAVGQIYSNQSGSWTTGSTWVGNAVPPTNSRVVIAAGHTVTLTGFSAMPIREVIVEPTATLVINGGELYLGASGIYRQLIVDGHMSIINSGYLESAGAPIVVNGTLSIDTDFGIDAGSSVMTVHAGGRIDFDDGMVYCRDFRLLASSWLYIQGGMGISASGNVSISGIVTSTGVFPSTKVFDVSGAFNVAGSIPVGSQTFSSNYLLSSGMTLQSGSEVRYIRNGNQNIEASLTYHNLTLGGSGDKTVSANLTVLDKFNLKGAARFVNSTNSSVSCGSNLIDSSSTTNHAFGTGSYTFTGTTIAATSLLNFTGASVTFSGSSVTIGDGAYGNANITFGTVNATNTNTALILGANAYSGALTFTSALTLSGTNASVLAGSGTLALTSLNASGGNAAITLQNLGTTLTGSLSCGGHISIDATTTVGGSLTAGGNLLIDKETDVTGSTTVYGEFRVNASGSGSNDLTGLVTVTGPIINITGGSTYFANGLSHTTTAAGSSCSIGALATVSTGATAPVTINAQSVNLAGSVSFYSLSITNPVGTFTATTDFSIAHTADFAKDLMMMGYRLTFGASAPITSMLGAGEVVGAVRRTLFTSGAYTFTGMYSTLLIPSLGSPEEYEFLFMKVAPDQQAVLRCWDIRRLPSCTTPAHGTYTLALQYKDADLNGNDESTLLMCYGNYGTAGEDQFEKLLSSTVNTSANIVTFMFDGVMSFNHRYTLADMNAPVPVELVSFSARRKSRSVDLRWTTATELNNYGFDVERGNSADGDFAAIGFVAGHGSKLSPTDYAFTDDAAPAGTLYYRLKQIDRDGSVTYGPVVEVTATTPTFELRNYPNPFNPSTTITFVAPNDGDAVLTVVNTLGEVVAEPYKGMLLHGERVSVPFNAADLPGGTYFYRLAVGESMTTGKMLLLK